MADARDAVGYSLRAIARVRNGRDEHLFALPVGNRSARRRLGNGRLSGPRDAGVFALHRPGQCASKPHAPFAHSCGGERGRRRLAHPDLLGSFCNPRYLQMVHSLTGDYRRGLDGRGHGVGARRKRRNGEQKAMGMKIPGEAKLLAGLAAVVLVGGGVMLLLSKASEISTAPPPPPSPKTISAEAFDKLLASARFSKGDANADVTIIEFADFECPSCRKAWRESLPKVSQMGKLRFVFRQMPLEMHERALPAALASEAAAKQGKFWQMYDGLFGSDSGNFTPDGAPIPALGDADIAKVATKIGLNLAQFNKDRVDNALTAKIQAEIKANADAGVTETPTFLIRGKSGKIDRVSGAGPLATYLASGALQAQMGGAASPAPTAP